MQSARFLTALSLGALVIVGLAACSSGTTPGWTYAPPPTASAAPSTAPGASAAASVAPAASAAAPSAAASVAPSAPASPAASAADTPAASPSGSGGAAAPTLLNESAVNLQFEVLKLEAPAGQAFQIAFDNKDASVQHNIQIAPPGGGPNVFEGEVITGVAQTTYNVNALQAGIYKFSCRIHPAMVGVLTAR